MSNQAPTSHMTRRTPITGIRRTPIRDSILLRWDDVYSKLVNYVKFASRNVATQYHTGVTKSAEDLFQEGLILLYKCFHKYRQKPYGEFAAIFKTSLWRKLRSMPAKRFAMTVDLEAAYNVGYTDDVVSQLYEENRLQQVADLLEAHPVALTIFKEFVNPSRRTCWEAEMDIARKSTIRDGGASTSVPTKVRIQPRFIQRAMGLPESQWRSEFRIVKECVAKVYLDQDDASDDEVSLALCG